MTEIDPVSLCFYNAPYQPDPHYLDRPSLKDKVEGGRTSDQPVALCGNPGTGKTHAAVHLAYDLCSTAPVGNSDTFVLWIDAKSAHSIVTSLHHIALQLDLPVIEEPRDNVCQLVGDWLKGKTSAGRRRHLVVLDGLKSLDLLDKPLRLEPEFLKYSEPTQKYRALRTYLGYGHGEISNLLITTRSCDIVDSLNAKCVTISDLTLDEAQSMCMHVMNEPSAHDAATTLIDQLGSTALIIRLAATYLRDTGMHPAEYIQKIAQSKKVLSTEKVPSTGFSDEFREQSSVSNIPNQLIAVIHETIDYLDNKYHDQEDEGIPAAFGWFSFGVGLGGKRVPLWMFTRSMNCPEDRDDAPSLVALKKLALVQRYGRGTYTISDLLQQGFWVWASTSNFRNAAIGDAQEDLNKLFGLKAGRGRGKAHDLLPWTELALANPMRGFEYFKALLEKRGRYFLSLQFYAEAWRDQNSVYQLCLERDGEDSGSEMVLTELSKLGHVAYNSGNYELAEKIHRQALEGFEKLEDCHSLVIDCLSDLAMTLDKTGTYTEAADFYRRAISLSEQSDCCETRVWTNTSHLADVLDNMGQLDEAFEMQSKAYTELVRITGESSKESRSALGRLSDSLARQKKWPEAVLKRKRELELTEAAEGPNSFGTLASVGNLARYTYFNGDKEESYRLHQRSLRGLHNRLGPDHPTTKAVENNMKHLFRHRLVTV